MRMYVYYTIRGVALSDTEQPVGHPGWGRWVDVDPLFAASYALTEAACRDMQDRLQGLFGGKTPEPPRTCQKTTMFPDGREGKCTLPPAWQVRLVLPVQGLTPPWTDCCLGHADHAGEAFSDAPIGYFERRPIPSGHG